MKKIKKIGQGFTLVELLVVISIIGILATLATVSFNSVRIKARDVKRSADMAQIQLALYIYYDDNQGFPLTDESQPGNSVSYWNNVLALALKGNNPLGRSYIDRVPFDPINAGIYQYGYNSLNNGQQFIIYYYREETGELKEFAGY